MLFRSNRIHAAIESFYEGIMLADMAEFQVGVGEEIRNRYGVEEFQPEKAFAHELGFGGKVDLHNKQYNSVGLVIDVKSKEFSDPEKVEAYDEHCMQLSAYRVGLGIPNAVCANIFVSATVPGLVVIKEWNQEELDRGWQMFQALLTFWQVKNNHK